MTDISRCWLAIYAIRGGYYRHCSVSAPARFRLTVWLRAQSVIQLTYNVIQNFVQRRWNEISSTLPMSLYVEKQTAYSNAPIGRDIQTWMWSYPYSVARRESWAYLNIISAILWVHVERTYPGGSRRVIFEILPLISTYCVILICRDINLIIILSRVRPVNNNFVINSVNIWRQIFEFLFTIYVRKTYISVTISKYCRDIIEA